MDTAIVPLTLTLIAVAAFLIGLRVGLATLLLIRPLCDRLFEASRFDVAGHALSFGAVMNIVVIGVALLMIGQILRRVPYGLKTAWLPLLLVTCVAIAYTPVPVDGLRKFLTYVSFAAMFSLSFVAVRNDRDFMFFLKIVILSSVLPLAYALIQIVFGVDWFLEDRIHSTFSHPNIFAFYIVAIVGTILYALSSRRIHVHPVVRLALVVYLVPLLVALIMTKTRSAWVACLFTFLLYGIVYDRRALVVVVIAPIFALAIPAVQERLLDLASGNDYIGGPAVMLNAYAWRQLLWENAFYYIWQQPIFGYGLDSFPFYSPRFFIILRNGESEGVYAHNVYIQFLFETGMVGLICFLWLFYRCFIWIFRFRRRDWPGAVMMAAMLVAYLAVAYSDNLFEYLTLNWCFWFVLGAMLGRLAGYVEKKKTFAVPVPVRPIVPDVGLAN